MTQTTHNYSPAIHVVEGGLVDEMLRHEQSPAVQDAARKAAEHSVEVELIPLTPEEQAQLDISNERQKKLEIAHEKYEQSRWDAFIAGGKPKARKLKQSTRLNLPQ